MSKNRQDAYSKHGGWADAGAESGGGIIWAIWGMGDEEFRCAGSGGAHKDFTASGDVQILWSFQVTLSLRPWT